MRKIFLIFQVLSLAALAVMTVVYMEIGGLAVKAGTAACFVLLGLGNLIYALLSRVKPGFPVMLCLGLLLAMTGDIALRFDFILGAGFFALGHLCYIAAMALLRPLSPKDGRWSLAVCLLSAGLVLLLPCFDFGGGMMLSVVLAYALIISCMAGKAFSLLQQKRSRLHILLALGSFLFYFSDFMLVLHAFGGAPPITDTLCLLTYFPGQGVLASTIYHYVNKEISCHESPYHR